MIRSESPAWTHAKRSDERNDRATSAAALRKRERNECPEAFELGFDAHEALK
jgi:hypothetical protein